MRAALLSLLAVTGVLLLATAISLNPSFFEGVFHGLSFTAY
jgi:hypothetical protein